MTQSDPITYLEKWKSGDLPPPPVTVLIDSKLTSFGDGTAEVVLEASSKHYNHSGTVHGGLISAFADVAMGVAIVSKLQSGESFSTVSMNTGFFKAFSKGRLTAKAVVVRRGRTTAYVECEVVSEKDLIAKASSSCVIIKTPISH
jgi:uncharacterized protein (TIGR00369 family)